MKLSNAFTSTQAGERRTLRLSIFPQLAGFLLLAALAAPLLAQGPAAAVTSPDHRLDLKFTILHNPHSTAESGRLAYSLLFNGKPLLENSGLSLSLAGGSPPGEDVSIVQVTPDSGIDDYNEVAGKTSHVHDAYNSVTVKVSEPDQPGRTMIVEARAYNGAVAFRYVVPEQPGFRRLELQEEHTEFNFDRDASTWALELPNFRSAFESEYVHLQISAFGAQGGEPARC